MRGQGRRGHANPLPHVAGELLPASYRSSHVSSAHNRETVIRLSLNPSAVTFCCFGRRWTMDAERGMSVAATEVLLLL